MGRRRRGEPVGEDVGTARGFSMVQVKFHGSSCSWRCVWRVKGIRTPPSSSSNSFFERFFPEPPPPPPVLPPRGRSSPPEPLPPRGKASSASSSSLVRLAPIARDQRACVMLECVATWPRRYGCRGRRRLEICLPPPTGARQRQVRVLFWGYGSLLGRIGGPFPPEATSGRPRLGWTIALHLEDGAQRC